MQTVMEDCVSNPPCAITLLVVDDHSIVRDGLVALLERSMRLRVVGAVGTGAEAIDAVRRLRPAVVLMDLMLPDLDGIEVTERIVRELPQTRVVMLSACHTPEHIVRGLRAGALAYVHKRSASTEIIAAVRAVAAGQPYVSESMRTALDRVSSTNAPVGAVDRLSAREREVLRRTAAGATSQAIARELFLSTKTVETYRSRIVRKLGVSDRVALIRFAIEHTLTDL